MAHLLSLVLVLAPRTAIELPPRPADALTGTAFAHAVTGLTLEQREARALAEIKAGNVPSRLRAFVPVTVREGPNQLTYEVAPDYVAIGSDDDDFLLPLSPRAAQELADLLGCSLPTTKMVDDIFKQAAIKLAPAPIPPSPAMTTVPVFLQHNATIRAQRKGTPHGALTAGHKKDVVITNKLVGTTGKVAIYGWHKPDGKPIQPLYTGHTAAWVDYSHGARLVKRRMVLNGQPTTIDAVLADPRLAPLLSDEGALSQTRYAAEADAAERGAAAMPGEAVEELRLEPGARIVINRPDPLPDRPILLVYYALPNGNTIEQTVGKSIGPGDDWRLDIQHIGAQTRFLRQAITDRALVVAYLENDLKSWPAWRRRHGDAALPMVLKAVRDRLPRERVRVVLNGHSGGGSLIFGFLNQVDAVPDDVERIAFLDSNYAYETEKHRDKLTAWLKAPGPHFLTVLAYNDAVALLNGKPFVSAAGGTWGRSRLMLADLGASFPFTSTPLGGHLERLTALDGRITFWLRENPERRVLHTVQVERNGFIESLLSGTPREGAGYAYFGERAYARFIQPE